MTGAVPLRIRPDLERRSRFPVLGLRRKGIQLVTTRLLTASAKRLVAGHRSADAPSGHLTNSSSLSDGRAVLLLSKRTPRSATALGNERCSMRERHFPRLCRSCEAPMARQEDACWRCGTRWATEAAPPTTLRAIAGGRLPRSPELARVAARLQAGRSPNEGAIIGAELGAPLRAVGAGG